MAIVIVALMLVVVSVVAAVLTMSERQYTRTGPGREPGTAGRERPLDYGSPLPRALAEALDGPGQRPARNSTEARALAALREAHGLAVDGAFEHQVRLALDKLDGVAALHDVRRPSAVGPPLAHLAVGSAGVFVIQPVVRTGRVTIGRAELLVGRGRSQHRDPVIDQVLRSLAGVVSVAEMVPVHGAVVFEDLLTLPDGIRSGTATLRGVHLLTLAGLERLVGAPGPVDDPEEVAQRLSGVFESSFTPGRRAGPA